MSLFDTRSDRLRRLARLRDAGAATSTLAGLGFGHHQVERDEVREVLRALEIHLDSALTSSNSGNHSDSRRYVKLAKRAHGRLAELLGKG